jgi:hypothetical protein
MRYSCKFLFAVPLLLIFVIFIANTEMPSKAYGSTEKSVFTANDKPYNMTFSDWAREWWQWHLSISDIKENKSLAHPRDSYSSEKCSWNQNDGPVWFLPDGADRSDLSIPEIRECNVPEGKALLVQIVGSGCSTGEGLKNDQELLDCAVWVLPTAEFSASIDGIEVMNTKNDPNDRKEFYVKPFKTNLTYVERSYYPVEPGTYDGMVAGYYLFVPPLPVGKHEIQFKESAVEFLSGFPSDKRLSNVEYNINVIPGT